jgi:DNA-binding NarL/FixJ family response regulator
MHIHSGLIQSLRPEPYEGDPKELSRDIPKDIGVIDRAENLPSRDEGSVLDLWGKGFTAKQIALRTGRTEKTILNRMTLMRKAYGEQLVPRRKMT